MPLCVRCDYMYATRIKLLEHLESVHNTRVCCDCRAEFLTPMAMELHRRAKHLKTVDCSCGTTFLCEQAKEMHRLTSHHVCPRCDAEFDSHDERNKHCDGTPLDIPDLMCTCGRRFRSVHGLEHHLESPTKLHQFVCIPCMTEFVSILDYSCHKHHYHDQDSDIDDGEEVLSDEASSEATAGNGDKGLVCRVCLDYPEKVVATACGHLYCRPCILEAIISDGRCPTCRTCLAPYDLRPIFL